MTGSNAPYFDIKEEKRLHDCCLELIQKGVINSAHDISEGGLAIALIESVITAENRAIGCDVELQGKWNNRKDFLLFGEEQSRIIVSTRPADHLKIEEICQKYSIDFSLLGKVTMSQRIKIAELVDLEREVAEDIYYNAIGKIMDAQR